MQVNYLIITLQIPGFTATLKGYASSNKNRNTFGIPVFAYFMHDWIFVKTYFNVMDMDNTEIRNLYDIARFERVEYEEVYKYLSNTGINRN